MAAAIRATATPRACQPAPPLTPAARRERDRIPDGESPGAWGIAMERANRRAR